MSVTLGILGVSPRITLTVPQLGGDPVQAMHSARRRFANQGAERVTLVPRREGEGWNVKRPTNVNQKEN